MKPDVRWMLVRVAVTFCALYALWLPLAFPLTFFSASVGAGCSFLIALGLYDVFIDDYEAARRAFIPRLLPLLAFPFLLAAYMYAASFKVSVSIVSGRADPRIVHFRTHLKSDLARVVLAEAVTFTPGTISLDLDEDHLVVHWLNATTRHSVRAGEEIKGALEAAIRRIWV